MRPWGAPLLLTIAAAAVGSASAQPIPCAVGGLRIGSNTYFQGGIGAIFSRIPTSLGFSVSVDADPLYSHVLGTVGTVWADTFPFAVAMNLGYYTDGEGGETRLKPEIGFGISGFRLAYAHAFRLGPGAVSGINSDEFVMHFIVPFSPLPDPRSGDR